MARGKVQLKRIENPVHRQVTFCKRRAGLLKKAKELSVLCDAHVGIFIFSAQGKLFELATQGTMQGMIERYMECTKGGESQTSESESAIDKQVLESKSQVNMLMHEIKLLEKGLWAMFGGAEGTMTLDELHVFEKHLESWIYQIRSTKMNVMFQEIQALKNKEGVLRAANKYLQQKVEEQHTIFDIDPLMMTNNPYELTIPNQISHY